MPQPHPRTNAPTDNPVKLADLFEDKARLDFLEQEGATLWLPLHREEGPHEATREGIDAVRRRIE